MQRSITHTILFSIGLSYFGISVASAQQIDPDLKELINKGVNKSHNVKIHDLNAEQAKIDQKSAKFAFLPSVTLNGSYTRLNDDINFDEDTRSLLYATQKLLIKEAAGIPFNHPFPDNIPLTEIPSIQEKNILKSSVDVDWLLFSGLQVTNAVKASKHKEASMNYIGLAEKDKVALKIMETYDQLALAHASKRVLDKTKDYLDKQENYVNHAIENGLATPIIRKKIELAQQQLYSKELEFKHKKLILIELLHQLTGENKESLAFFNPNLQPYEYSSLTETEKRNEIKALEAAEQASLFKSKMEKSNYIPKIAVRGHYEFLEEDLSLLDPKWYVGVGIKWSVFDGLQSQLKSKKSVIESKKYRAQAENADEKIALSIINAQLNYESSIQNIEVTQKEIELASATYEMVNKQYKNNLASINDVLDALTDLEKANFKLQESFFNQRRATTELLNAKGILTSFYN